METKQSSSPAMTQCQQCLAYYSAGFRHDCPPWMVALNQYYKNSKKQRNLNQPK